MAGVCLLCPVRAVEVRLQRIPLGGLQPQVATDVAGTVHLVFLQGSPAEADVFYCRRRPGAAEFSLPVKVNSEPGSALALGTIRGPQMAVSFDGVVHIVWNGSKTAPQHPGVAFFYTRLPANGTAFEPQRDLATTYHYLDGGGAVAVNPAGVVRAFWHGRLPDSVAGEAGRTLVFTESRDRGRSFSPEQPALQEATGACACCAMRAWADTKGGWHIFFRSATPPAVRDETLLYAAPAATQFTVVARYPWKTPACPMSSVTFTEAGGQVWAAWETVGQIQFGNLDGKTQAPKEVRSPAGSGSRKHPVISIQSKGETLVAWIEGSGWQRGGTLAWECWDAQGRSLARGRAPGVPAWGLLALLPEVDGTWTLLY